MKVKEREIKKRKGNQEGWWFKEKYSVDMEWDVMAGRHKEQSEQG